MDFCRRNAEHSSLRWKGEVREGKGEKRVSGEPNDVQGTVQLLCSKRESVPRNDVQGPTIPAVWSQRGREPPGLARSVIPHAKTHVRIEIGISVERDSFPFWALMDNGLKTDNILFELVGKYESCYV